MRATVTIEKDVLDELVKATGARSKSAAVKAIIDEYLRKRKGGVAVAQVEDGNCGACHVSLPTGTLSALHGEARVYCPSCGRILYRP